MGEFPHPRPDRSGATGYNWDYRTPPTLKIMEFAREGGFAVLTHDLDFGAMLAANRGDKPSAIQFRADDLRPEVIGDRVLQALRAKAAEIDAGALVTIDPGRTG